MQRFEPTFSWPLMIERLNLFWERIRRHLPSLAAAFAIVITITAFQYFKYGTERFLGWDTANYVYLTVLIDQFGLETIVQIWHYPQLYVLTLWLVGKSIGDVGLAARLLPFFWLFVLLAGYQALSWRLSQSIWLSGLTVILAGITIGTIRIFSDLHRSLMALSLAFVVLVLVSRRSSGALKLTRTNLLILVLLIAILATQIEMYAVLAFGLFLSTLFARNLRRSLEMAIFLAIPIVLLSPSMIPLLIDYPASLSGLSENAVNFGIVDAALFGAGSLLTLPFVALGIVYIFKRTKEGSLPAQLVAGLLIALAILFSVLAMGIVRLPAIRVLYLVPVPLLLAMSLPALEWLSRRRRREAVVSGAS